VARILFQIVFPIVLPALIYALWMTAERRKAEAAATEKRQWSDAPWLYLLMLGLFFAAVIGAATAYLGGEPASGVYVPPELRDGQVVPGHVVPK
jgi:hypothetical protein